MDSIITLFALRYALRKGNNAMTKVSKYIISHIDEISCEDLNTFLKEIEECYADKSKEEYYSEAITLVVTIKRELYGEVE